MMADSSVLIGLQGHFLNLILLLAIASVRLFVMFMILPATSSEILPGIARNGVVYVLGGFIAYGQPADVMRAMQVKELVFLVGKEAMIGLVLGYAASTVFWVAQNIGTIIDDLAGFNNVQMSNPLRDEQSTPIANTLLQFSVTLFYCLGGMITLLHVVFDSFQAWPLLAVQPQTSRLFEPFILSNTDSMMTMAIKLSAPIVLLLVLVDAAIGLVSRNADRLEPANLSQPIRGALALILLALLIQIFVAQVQGALSFVNFQSELKSLFPT